jgi:hypothetical protein
MMQTFLPYEDFARSASVIDTKRLGKQRVEAKQILIALGVNVGDHIGNASSRWRHHPAVLMWKGHEDWLATYAVCICREWINRGCRDSLLGQFADAAAMMPIQQYPKWLGVAEFHRSHRSNLLRKYPEHYSRFGWSEPDDLEYVWPSRGEE